MRLTRIDLTGFRHLTDFHLSLHPRLNLVFGPNEAGKSTLHAALVALLYGFYDDGTITAAMRQTAQSFRPRLSDAEFGGALTYALDGGREFRATRIFGSRGKTTLHSLPDGRDMTARFKAGKEGQLFFADEQLGISRQVFENVCVVRQSEIALLDNAITSITDILSRMAASAGAGVTASSALGQIEDVLKEQVGTERARTKPLPLARKHLDELKSERDRNARERESYWGLVKASEAHRKELKRLDETRARLQYLELCAKAESLRAQLGAVRGAQEEVKARREDLARWEPWSGFPESLHAKLIEGYNERRRLEEELETNTTGDEPPEPLQLELEALEARIASLEDARGVRREIAPEVQQLTEALKSAVQAVKSVEGRLREATAAVTEMETAQEPRAADLPEHSELADLRQRLALAQQRLEEDRTRLRLADDEWKRTGLTEEQFEVLRVRVQAIENGAKPTKRKGCRPHLKSRIEQQPNPDVAIYAGVHPIHEHLQTAQANVQAAQQALGDDGASVRARLGSLVEPGRPLDDSLFHELDGLRERALRMDERLKGLRASQRTAEAELADARMKHAATANKLLRLLDAGSDDVKNAVTVYMELYRRNHDLREAEAEAEKLRMRHEWAIQRQSRQQRLDQVASELRALLAQAGLTGGLDDGLEAFQSGVENYQQWRAASQALDQASGYLSQVEADATETWKSLRRVEEDLATNRDAQPGFADLVPDRSERDYAGLISQCEEQRERTQGALAEARRDQETLAGRILQPAELDEDIAEAEATVRSLQWFGNALQLAHDELLAAATQFQKQFAPRLERLLSESLAYASVGRYADVHIDPMTLAVSLTSPDSGMVVGADELSTGTRDLVYLMLRVSLARDISRSGEQLPLLLDDPLVHCDRHRKERILEFLSRLADQTQMILFTQDEWTRSWFEENVGNYAITTLN